MQNKITSNISLKNYNTFGLDVKASNFISVTTTAELLRVLQLEEYPEKFIIGGGSNILLTRDINALVIHIALKGIREISRDEQHAIIRVAAGESWHEVVLWCISNNLGGIENLSLIPGNTGTAPIQNIGAYGVELKDVFVSCEAIDLHAGEVVTLPKAVCEFGYRDSIFKTKAKGRYVITSVDLKLTSAKHQLNTSYGAIENELEKRNISKPNLKDISDAVISIRRSKLPDPKKLGNSGSFFKNPVIASAHFEEILKEFPEMPHYRISKEEVKIPAGWLIEQCGFKGKKFGEAGVHDKQALVLVNYGNAKGAEIAELAANIQQNVLKTFGITIEPEVNII